MDDPRPERKKLRKLRERLHIMRTTRWRTGERSIRGQRIKEGRKCKDQGGGVGKRRRARGKRVGGRGGRRMRGREAENPREWRIEGTREGKGEG